MSRVDTRQYLKLQEAIMNASDNDREVIIIPPDGSDMEDFNEDVTAPQPLQEVSGYLEILNEAEELETNASTKWRKNRKLNQIQEGDSIPPLTTNYPFLQGKSALQYFQLL